MAFSLNMPCLFVLQRELEDLADATLANLGLSRVANSIVGDVNRRGVSGGEKKRVNIGVTLMARVSIVPLLLQKPCICVPQSDSLCRFAAKFSLS